jgi:distribution and morphology protein 31
VDIKALLEEIGRNVANITSSDPDSSTSSSSMSDTLASSAKIIPGQHRLHRPPLRAPRVEGEEHEKEKRILIMDIDLRFRDLKAAVPIWSGDLSVANNALIRPIVAFIK